MSADAEIAALMLSNPELVIIDDGLPDGRVQSHAGGQISDDCEQSERNKRNRAKGANFQSLLNTWMAANEWVFTEGHPKFNRNPKSGLWFPVADSKNKAGYLIRWGDAETRWHCISTRRGPKGQTFGRWDGFAVSDDELLNDVLEWYGFNPYE